MAAPVSNPLMSSQTSSDLHVILHPLVLLNISDYITRHTLRQHTGPVVGAMLGKNDGREITVEHAFECLTVPAPDVQGGYQVQSAAFGVRLEQMKTVHRDRQLDLVGWYTLLPSSGPSANVLPIHQQILEGWNESAILLGFHPEQVLQQTTGGELPLTIFEGNYEVDDTKAEDDGEDKKMEDGGPPVKLKFRKVTYSVETDETEMIGMNYVAAGGGSAATNQTKEDKSSLSLASDGKGKRRLVESEEEEKTSEASLSRDEEEMIAALTAKQNAIKMLDSRLKLLTLYLESLPPAFVRGEQDLPEVEVSGDETTPSYKVLRQIQALVNRFDLVIPSDRDAFEAELKDESNNVDLLDMLSSVVQGLNEARLAGQKFQVVEQARKMKRGDQADSVHRQLAAAYGSAPSQGKLGSMF